MDSMLEHNILNVGVLSYAHILMPTKAYGLINAETLHAQWKSI